ncbi:uncharacterized protein LOC119268179 isoform X3 [Triticum dicoccoides]|uniref:uncharacterized protein LOC119268179 isoform X3 n=1 Tax=Triticum dicoccoides TaxID=85692 RepID=UPI00188F31D2|nr:uncharacterized protein LOC119268179 isoform X3 [Triticum dicoccoides]
MFSVMDAVIRAPQADTVQGPNDLAVLASSAVLGATTRVAGFRCLSLGSVHLLRSSPLRLLPSLLPLDCAAAVAGADDTSCR